MKDYGLFPANDFTPVKPVEPEYNMDDPASLTPIRVGRWAVIDGDTVVDTTTGENIRLRGIDTDETPHRLADGTVTRGEKGGLRARAQLARYLREAGENVTLERTGKDAQHGRTVGVLRDGQGRDLGLEIVKAGFGAFEQFRGDDPYTAERAAQLNDPEYRKRLAERYQESEADGSNAELRERVLANRGVRKGSDWDRGVDNLQASIGAGVAAVGTLLDAGWAAMNGDDTGVDIAPGVIRRYGEEVRDRNLEEASKNLRDFDSWRDVDGALDALEFVGERVMENLPQVALDVGVGATAAALSIPTGGASLGLVAFNGALARATAQGASAAAAQILARQAQAAAVRGFAGKKFAAWSTAAMYPQMVGESVMSIEEDGVEDVAAAATALFVTGPVNVALEKFGFDRLLSSVKFGGPGAVSRVQDVLMEVGKSVGIAAPTEGLTEVAQTIVSDLGARMNGATHDLDTEEVLEAFFSGMAAGGGMAGAGRSMTATLEYMGSRATQRGATPPAQNIIPPAAPAAPGVPAAPGTPAPAAPAPPAAPGAPVVPNNTVAPATPAAPPVSAAPAAQAPAVPTLVAPASVPTAPVVTAAEPVADLTAQVERFVSGEKQAVFVSAANRADMPAMLEMVPADTFVLESEAGVLLTRDEALAEEYVESDPARQDVLRAQALGITQAKADVATPAAAQVVRTTDPAGAVVAEAAVDPAQVLTETAAQEAAARPSDTVGTSSVQDVLARRESAQPAHPNADIRTRLASRVAQLVEASNGAITAPDPAVVDQVADAYQAFTRGEIQSMDVPVTEPALVEAITKNPPKATRVTQNATRVTLTQSSGSRAARKFAAARADFDNGVTNELNIPQSQMEAARSYIDNRPPEISLHERPRRGATLYRGEIVERQPDVMGEAMNTNFGPTVEDEANLTPDDAMPDESTQQDEVAGFVEDDTTVDPDAAADIDRATAQFEGTSDAELAAGAVDEMATATAEVKHMRKNMWGKAQAEDTIKGLRLKYPTLDFMLLPRLDSNSGMEIVSKTGDTLYKAVPVLQVFDSLAEAQAEADRLVAAYRNSGFEAVLVDEGYQVQRVALPPAVQGQPDGADQLYRENIGRLVNAGRGAARAAGDVGPQNAPEGVLYLLSPRGVETPFTAGTLQGFGREVGGKTLREGQALLEAVGVLLENSWTVPGYSQRVLRELSGNRRRPKKSPTAGSESLAQRLDRADWGKAARGARASLVAELEALGTTDRGEEVTPRLVLETVEAWQEQNPRDTTPVNVLLEELGLSDLIVEEEGGDSFDDSFEKPRVFDEFTGLELHPNSDFKGEGDKVRPARAARPEASREPLSETVEAQLAALRTERQTARTDTAAQADAKAQAARDKRNAARRARYAEKKAAEKALNDAELLDVLQQPAASRNTRQATRVAEGAPTTAKVRGVVQAFKEMLGGSITVNGQEVQFRVIDDFSAVENAPAWMQERAGEKGFVTTSTQTGQIYVVLQASRHTSLADVEQTLRHEVLVHVGMAKFMTPAERTQLLNAVKAARNTTLSSQWAQIERRYPGETRDSQAEEVIALVSEQHTPVFWTRVKNLVLGLMRRLGLATADFRKSEIDAVVHQTLRHWQEGAGQRGDGVLGGTKARSAFASLLFGATTPAGVNAFAGRVSATAKAMPQALPALFTVDRELRVMGAPELADRLSQQSSSTRHPNITAADGASFTQGVADQRAVWFSKWDNVVIALEARQRGATKAALDELSAANEMGNPATLSPDARRINAFLQGFRSSYLVNHIPNIGRLTIYMPRMFDIAETDLRRPELVNLLMTTGGLGQTEADAYVQSIIDDGAGMGGFSFDPALNTITPQMDARYKRMLAVPGLNAALQAAGFLQKNDASVIQNYLSTSVKYAEWSRVNAGGKIHRLINALPGREQVRARTILEGYLGRIGLDRHPTAVKAMSWALVFESYTLLLFSAVASLPDLAGPVLRSRDFDNAKHAMFALSNVMANYGDARERARMMGLLSERLTSQALKEAHGMSLTSASAQGALTKLFHYNGQEALTGMSRTAALAVGEEFLVNNANRAQAGDARAARYLQELNITQAQVHEWDSNGRPLGELNGTLASTRSANAALYQFVDESVLRPNASQRPLWANDPALMLIWHLKSFFYAYGKVVLGGVAREAGSRWTEGNGVSGKTLAAAVPFAIAGLALLPLAALARELREEIMYMFNEEDEPTNRESGLEYVWGRLHDAGVFGPLEIIMGANRFADSPDEFVAGLAGPTVSHLYSLGTGVASENGLTWSDLKRATPGMNQLPWLNDYVKGVVVGE
jgi:endonuclease YncB( thermonuclease family)